MSRVPDLLVEKLHLGELAPDVAQDVRARLAAEPGGLDRLAALADSDRDLAPRLRPLAPRPVPRNRTLRWLGPALATAALATLAIIAWPNTDQDLRAKGEDRLVVFRLEKTGPAVLTHGAIAAPGDRLQLTAHLAEPRHLAILSIDGLGAVTVHEPATTTPVREVHIPRSFVLDDAPRFERFFLFTSATPLDQAALSHALGQLGVDTRHPPDLPSSITITELRLDKPAPR